MFMTFKVFIQTNNEYYIEAYSESISKFKKIEPILAIGLIIFGIILFVIDSQESLSFFPFFFVLAGPYEIFRFYYTRKKWLNDRFNSPANNSILEIEFNDKTIKHSGPTSKGEFDWSLLKAIKETPKGIVLRMKQGLMIYLPKTVFENQSQMEFILAKSWK